MRARRAAKLTRRGAMRPRSPEELSNPERLMRALTSQNPAAMPRWFRQQAREKHADELMTFLADTAMGRKLFEHVTIGGQIVMAPATPTVRVKAAELVLDIAIPKQVGITNDDQGPGGVIALPASELVEIQAEQQRLLPSHNGTHAGDVEGEEFIPREG